MIGRGPHYNPDLGMLEDAWRALAEKCSQEIVEADTEIDHLQRTNFETYTNYRGSIFRPNDYYIDNRRYLRYIAERKLVYAQQMLSEIDLFRTNAY